MRKFVGRFAAALVAAAALASGAQAATLVGYFSGNDPFGGHEKGGGRPVQTTPLPYRIDGAPTATGRRAPNVGEHTAEILRDWLSRS